MPHCKCGGQSSSSSVLIDLAFSFLEAPFLLIFLLLCRIFQAKWPKSFWMFSCLCLLP